jgi:hypothetical protein
MLGGWIRTYEYQILVCFPQRYITLSFVAFEQKSVTTTALYDTVLQLLSEIIYLCNTRWYLQYYIRCISDNKCTHNVGGTHNGFSWEGLLLFKWFFFIHITHYVIFRYYIGISEWGIKSSIWTHYFIWNRLPMIYRNTPISRPINLYAK